VSPAELGVMPVRTNILSFFDSVEMSVVDRQHRAMADRMIHVASTAVPLEHLGAGALTAMQDRYRIGVHYKSAVNSYKRACERRRDAWDAPMTLQKFVGVMVDRVVNQGCSSGALGAFATQLKNGLKSLGVRWDEEIEAKRASIIDRIQRAFPSDPVIRAAVITRDQLELVISMLDLRAGVAARVWAAMILMSFTKLLRASECLDLKRSRAELHVDGIKIRIALSKTNKKKKGGHLLTLQDGSGFENTASRVRTVIELGTAMGAAASDPVFPYVNPAGQLDWHRHWKVNEWNQRFRSIMNEYLGAEDAEAPWTSHSMRRSGAQGRRAAGATLEELEEEGRWARGSSALRKVYLDPEAEAARARSSDRC
jgi:integrase